MEEAEVFTPDDYCNDCGNSDVPLRAGHNGHVICDDCSYRELQDQMEEFELIKNARSRIGKEQHGRRAEVPGLQTSSLAS